MDNMDNTCFICMDEMEDIDKCTLNCNHQFHTECMKFAIINTKNNNYQYGKDSSIKECPYCRTLIDIIPLKENETPILGIHFKNDNCCKQIILSGKNKNKICGKKIYTNSMCLYHVNTKQCHAIYKTGKNKGKRCTTLTKNKNGEVILCGKHKNTKVAINQ